MADRPKAYSWMRVDLPDYLRNVAYMVRELQRAQKALILPHPMPGAAAEIAGFVLSDFDTDPASIGTTTVTILVPATTARAILAEVADGAVHPGQMAEDELGAATLTLATASFSLGAGVYDVYVRWLISPTNPGARAYWNATTTTENSQTKDMDDQAIMELGAVATGAAPPWGGGLLIASVTLNAINVITGYTDRRPMLFEGDADAAVAWEPGWGDGANDRNAARGTHGVKDLSTFVRFCRRQIEDILGGANRAWSVINGVLPTLDSLNTDHWYEGIGGAAEGHHRTQTRLVSTIPGGAVELGLQDQAGLTFWVQKSGADRWLSFFGSGGAGSLVALKLDAAGSPGGIVISGPNGPGAPLAAGEAAYLRFGEMGAGAGWLLSPDFAIAAHGAATDPDRSLLFEVGDGGGGINTVLALYGTGFAVAVDPAGGFRTAGTYSYSPNKTVWRSLSAMDFLPVDFTGVVPTIVLTEKGITIGVAFPSNDKWYRVITDAAAGLQLETGGWGIQLPVAGRITDGASPPTTLAVSRLGASLAWLPNKAIIVNGDALWLRAETDLGAAWRGAGTQRLAVAIIRVERSTGFSVRIAYAQFDLSAGGVDTYRYVSTVWVGGGTIDHSLYDYSLLVQPDNTAGAGGAMLGAMSFASLSFAFQVSTLSH